MLFRNRTELGGNVLHSLTWDARFSAVNQLAVIEVLFNSSTFRDRLLNEKDIKDETPLDVFGGLLDKDFDGFAEIGLMTLDHGIHVPDFLHHAMRHKNNDLVAAIYKHTNYQISGDEQILYLVHREKFKESYPSFATDKALLKFKYKHEMQPSFDLTAKALITKDTEFLNMPSFCGATMLHSAAGYGYTEFAKELIKNGANLEAKANDGNTPILDASQYKHFELVKIFIKSGANVNAKDDQGKTPLRYSALYGNTETVMLLLENGATPTEELRQLVIQRQKSSEYEKESYEKILKLFDEYFKQQELKAALNIQGSTSSNMLGSAAVPDDPNGAIVNLTEGVTAMFINQLSESKSAETGKGV